MKPSNRQRILEAAVELIEREGITALTFDALAAESGVTRGGIIYHFNSRDDLIDAIHHHLARKWEDSLNQNLNIGPASSALDESLTAYIRTCAHKAGSAELQLILHDAHQPASRRHWRHLLDSWAPRPDLSQATSGEVAGFLARLAADGLWLHEALTGEPLTDHDRNLLTNAIIATLIHPE